MSSKDYPLDTIIKSLTSGKTKDYTYLTGFFIVFSVFVLFIIRPSLSTAFALNKEGEDLRAIDEKYEKLISDIVVTQANYQMLRERMYLLNEGLPHVPQINAMLNDIRKAAGTTQFTITNMSMTSVSLVEGDRSTIKPVVVQIEGVGSYEDYLTFQSTLNNQRRLKIIKKLEILKANTETSASISGKLQMKMQVDGYYL